MSILDRYPEPWRSFPKHAPPLEVCDANGKLLMSIGSVELLDKELERLMMSVPELLKERDELLAALNTTVEVISFLVNDDGPVRALVRHDRKTIPDPRSMAMALIARIDGNT
jgi:hypothetical protein